MLKCKRPDEEERLDVAIHHRRKVIGMRTSRHWQFTEKFRWGQTRFTSEGRSSFIGKVKVPNWLLVPCSDLEMCTCLSHFGSQSEEETWRRLAWSWFGTRLLPRSCCIPQCFCGSSHPGSAQWLPYWSCAVIFLWNATLSISSANRQRRRGEGFVTCAFDVHS